jgi:hypothetical protein
MACPQVEDGGTASTMEVKWNILKKQSWTAYKSGPPAWSLVEVLTSPHRKTVSFYEPFKEIAHLE